MLTKNQLQTKIEQLESELQSFKVQLNNYKETPTLQEANVGDTLGDGSIVLKKENGLALLVAPKNTEVEAEWSKEFPEVFEKLKSNGFNPSQWFVPSIEQLKLAYRNVPNDFSSTGYWSSTEGTAFAYGVPVNFGVAYYAPKSNTYCVRAFRCITY